MNDATSVTLNITEIIALLGLVWGFAKMTQKLDGLVLAVDKVTEEVAKIVGALADTMGRVSVLEDRSDRDEESPRGRRR